MSPEAEYRSSSGLKWCIACFDSGYDMECLVMIWRLLYDILILMFIYHMTFIVKCVFKELILMLFCFSKSLIGLFS